MRGPALALLLALAAGPGSACGDVATEEPCTTASGRYWIEMPEGAEGPVPAIVFLHGAGASGRGIVANMGLDEAFTAAGWAFVAPDGLGRDGRPGGGWSFLPQRPERRDERAFLAGVRADAAARFGLDPDRMVLAGFSIGGSMTSYLACEGSRDFAAYAPVAGSFWRPHPEGCAGPVRLLHTHGWADGTVPLEGRPLRGGEIVQGDVFAAMEIWRRANGCDGLRADAFPETEGYWRRAWTACAPGSALGLALHPGGHSVPRGWAEMVLGWLGELGV